MANLLYNLAQPFSDTKQYTQGTIVIYNDRMYEMTADEYTPGPFDPEKFTERFLSEMISGKLNSNLTPNNITVIAQPQDNDSTAVGRQPTVTIDLERNGIYLIASGTAYNQTQDITITSNSGSFDVLVHENRIPEARTSGGGSNGVYFYIIQAGADGANVTIQGTSYTIFSVYKISC